ncbi:hypothetical protein [Rhizobium leguminosarum]|uniref:hypothetical protein n=1 Tax=Rhizobium leguminosarum TaxID=384 RepID=UPI001F310C2A|nr:hypothetical protein [Rhizobium leguminosarum]
MHQILRPIYGGSRDCRHEARRTAVINLRIALTGREQGFDILSCLGLVVEVKSQFATVDSLLDHCQEGRDRATAGEVVQLERFALPVQNA